MIDRKSNADTWKQSKDFGWQLDNGKSGCGVVIKGKVAHNHQNGSDYESWHCHGGRDDRRVRAYENPGSDFPQLSVCSEHHPLC